MKKALVPTLESIKRKLFAPSDALVTQWVEEPETLHPKTRQALEASELAQQEKQSYRAGKTFSQTEKIMFEPEPDALSKVPDHIKNLILRHCDAAKHTFSPLPNGGLIVLINEAIGPEGVLPIDIANPMVVLLNQPTDQHKLVWTGWVIASETDYASCWDMVLDPEIDAPLDPIVGMVQTWNRVNIYLPSIEKTIGELKPERLALVRELADEQQFGQTDIETTMPSEPGHLVPRLVNNKPIVTGTPLSSNPQDDPRWEYQDFYHKAGNVIREPAMLAISPALFVDIFEPEPEPEPEPATINPLSSIKQWINNYLVPISRTQFAMSAASDKKPLDIDNIRQFEDRLKTYYIIIKRQEEDAGLIYDVLIKLQQHIDYPIAFEYKEDGVLKNKHLFTNNEADQSYTFLCDPDEDYEFIFMNHTGEKNVWRANDFNLE